MIKDYDITTISGRLAFLINHLKSNGIVTSEGKMDIGSFAREIKIDSSQFSRIINGKVGITLSQIMEITSIFKVRAGWLIEGEEPIFKKESGPLREPDHELLAKMREEIETIKVSLHRLSDLVPSVQEEKIIQEVTYEETKEGKTP